MVTLNAWQKLTRVLPTQPFGNGADGVYSSATVPTLTNLAVTGVATETHIHATTANFAANDIILLHQVSGTGAGQWEINKITADNGDGTYNVMKALNYSYVSGARVIKIPQYTNATVDTGTWSANGTFVFACSNLLTVTGTVSSGGGYAGGSGAPSTTGIQGSSYNGAGSASTAANATGGGGGAGEGSSGGGGGYGTSGTSAGGSGGGTVGSADLTTLFDGGGGGQGGDKFGNEGAAGGAGGGAILVFAKTITITGGMTVPGTDGTGSSGADRGSGGGGAGGSILLVCKTATLGSSLVTALGGAGGSAFSRVGGAGGAGRIAIHHVSTVTGTTNPTFTDVTDTSLVENAFLGGMI